MKDEIQKALEYQKAMQEKKLQKFNSEAERKLFWNLCFFINRRVTQYFNFSRPDREIQELKSLMQYEVQKVALDAFINSPYDVRTYRAGLLNPIVLSSPGLCNILLRTLIFEEIRDDLNVDSMSKKEVKPTDFEFASLMINKPEVETWFMEKRVQPWLIELYYEMRYLLNAYDERLDIKSTEQLERLGANFYKIWRTYNLEALQAYYPNTNNHMYQVAGDKLNRMRELLAGLEN